MFVAAAMLLAAGSAQAGSLPFHATLSIQIAALDPMVFSGSGVAIANGSGGGTHIGSLALAGSSLATTGLVMPVTDPAAYPFAGLQLTAHNGAGAFTAGPGLGGVMPIAGAARICMFAYCGSAIANVTVPLSIVGAGGSTHVAVAMNMTVVGAPWTTGTAAVGTVTAMGAAYGPASGSSSTFAPGGRLQLVTPLVFHTSIGASPILPGFATLKIDFVPEPATLLLLGSGIAGLAFAGRARRG